MAWDRAALRKVSLTEARNLSPLFEEAVRNQHPVLIVRNRREWGLLLSRDAMLRMLASHRLRVNVLPEEDGSFTLWLRELSVGAHGLTLREARQQLLVAVRSYISDYLEQFDLYRQLPDRVSQEPYILRLSLARDDAELIEMLFPLASATEDEPEVRTTAG